MYVTFLGAIFEPNSVIYSGLGTFFSPQDELSRVHV